MSPSIMDNDKSRIVTGKQIVAARAVLKWSRDDLADRSGLHSSTVRYYERSNHLSRRTSKNYGLLAIKRACSNAGITFPVEPTPSIAMTWDHITRA